MTFSSILVCTQGISKILSFKKIFEACAASFTREFGAGVGLIIGGLGVDIPVGPVDTKVADCVVPPTSGNGANVDVSVGKFEIAGAGNAVEEIAGVILKQYGIVSTGYCANVNEEVGPLDITGAVNAVEEIAGDVLEEYCTVSAGSGANEIAGVTLEYCTFSAGVGANDNAIFDKFDTAGIVAPTGESAGGTEVLKPGVRGGK